MDLHRLRWLPWALLVVLGGLRLGLSAYRCPWVAVHPDVALWNPGAKHWAFYGEWRFDQDLSLEFVAPVQAFLAGAVFRAFGPSYAHAVMISQLAVLGLMAAFLWFLRDEDPLALSAGLLLFWADYAVSMMAYLGTNEGTLLFFLGLATLLVAARPPGAAAWAAAGAAFTLAVFTKLTCLIFVPALLACAWARPEPSRRARTFLAFLGGVAVAAAPFAWFVLSHRPAAGRALDFLLYQAGDHDRPLWQSIGVFLFHWNGAGWRHALLPALIFCSAAWVPDALSRGDADPRRDRLTRFGWFALSGAAGLAVYPPAPGRFSMVVLPLAYLAGRVLADRSCWGALLKKVARPRAALFLFCWQVACMAPVFSWIKEAWVEHLRGLGEKGIGPETRTGYLLLPIAVLAAEATFRLIPFLAGPAPAGIGRLLAGAAWLVGAFALVRLDGIAAHLAGLHADPLAGKILAAALSATAGIACMSAAFRILGGSIPGRSPVFLRALAALLVVLGLVFPVKRFLVTRYTDKRLDGIAREMGRHIPEDAVVYGDVWADVLLLPVKCKVVTIGPFLPTQLMDYFSSTAQYQWNRPMRRFAPTHLLLANGHENPDVMRVWGPLLAGYGREGPLCEFDLERGDGGPHDRIRLYRLRWNGSE